MIAGGRLRGATLDSLGEPIVGYLTTDELSQLVYVETFDALAED